MLPRFFLSCLWLVCLSHVATASHTNVLLIISDDLNCDLGCYGSPVVQSPHLDRLASQGVRFDRAYVQYTVCNPSRTSFLTGLRPEVTRILDNGTYFRERWPDLVTMPQWFRQHGYYTASVGKVFHRGLSPDQTESERDDPLSWDERFYGTATALGRTGEGRNLTNGELAWCKWLAAEGNDEDQHDGQVTRRALEILAERQDQPFFLAVGYYRPHDPFHSPKKYFELYPPESLALPVTPQDRTPELRYALPGGGFQKSFDQFTDQERREFLRAYYAGISFVDAQVGRLLTALTELNLDRNTVVVFIGDHGYELGYRNWWNKNTLFERSCRTPLIVRAPQVQQRGVTSQAIVEFVDLYPTIVDLCGLTGPEGVQGTSFVPVLNDPTTETKQEAWTTVERGRVRGLSLRTDRWRYTEWNAGAEGAELYDHQRDPGEWQNIAGKEEWKDVQRKLSERMAKFRLEMEQRNAAEDGRS